MAHKSSTGEAAGRVWKQLSKSGEISVASLTKSVQLPRATVDRALGWLDKEQKINWNSKGNIDVVALTEEELNAIQ